MRPEQDRSPEFASERPRRASRRQASAPAGARPDRDGESSSKPGGTAAEREGHGGLPGSFKALACGLLAVAAVSFGVARGSYAGANDEDAPNFEKHSKVITSNPMFLAPDRRLTRDVRKQIQSGADLQIPGSPEIPPGLLPDLAGDDVTWYRVTFHDTCAEDGDWVSLTLDNGMFYPTFPILHAGHEIAIPVKKGRSPIATMRADVDGQGGVTVGAVTEDGTWYSAVLPVGGTQTIPIRTR